MSIAQSYTEEETPVRTRSFDSALCAVIDYAHNSFICHTQFQKVWKWKGHRPLMQVPAVAQGFGKQRELCEQDPFFQEKVAYCILQAARSKDPG